MTGVLSGFVNVANDVVDPKPNFGCSELVEKFENPIGVLALAIYIKLIKKRKYVILYSFSICEFNQARS